MLWIFEHYSRTEDNAKKPDLLPFKIKLAPTKIQTMLDEYFRKECYSVIKNKPEFNEFFAVYNKFEVTIHMVPDGQITRIVVAAYTENRIGITRKKVMSINSDLKTLFKDYIVE